MDFSTGMTILTLTVGVLSAFLLIAIAYIGINYFTFTRRIKKSVKAEITRLRHESTALTTTAKDLAISVSHYNNGMTCRKLKEYEYSFYSFILSAQLMYRIKDKIIDDSDHFESAFTNLIYLIDEMESEKITISSTQRNFNRMLNALNQVEHKSKNRVLSFCLLTSRLNDNRIQKQENHNLRIYITQNPLPPPLFRIILSIRR